MKVIIEIAKSGSALRHAKQQAGENGKQKLHSRALEANTKLEMRLRAKKMRRTRRNS